MSSALVRQALELVDQEECLVAKRGGRARRPAGQDHRRQFKNKNKRGKVVSKSQEQITEENIKKLLALTQPSADPNTADKIVERAIKQKPLADKIEVKVDENKSILFPEGAETFKDFESELFCS